MGETYAEGGHRASALFHVDIEAYLGQCGHTLGCQRNAFLQVECLFGNKVIELSDSPLTRSSSPSDFWGRRWNNLIHVGLKQGVYKPVRKATDSRTLASIAAFCVSGIYHEYVSKVLFYSTIAQREEADGQGGCCSTCYCDAWFGKQLLFFAWNAILIAMEYAVGDRLQPIARRLPAFLRSHLLVMLSLPMGHLLMSDMTMSGFFQGMQQALPLVQVTPVS